MRGEATPLLRPTRLLAERTRAAQQPQWQSHPDYQEACATLACAPALVTAEEISELRTALAAVAAGDGQVLQAGDCAESFDEIGQEHVQLKLALLHQLADQLEAGGGHQVLRIGRLGGQFAKPRSAPVEAVAGTSLPVFRGHMVNSPEPTPAARVHDPRRMVRAHAASAAVLELLRADRAGRGSRTDGPWSSHDALVLDYEANLVRSAHGRPILASTHLPWIGDRTRQPDSPHVRLLASVANPVAGKIGPTITVQDLCALCARLDPDRIPGRLTLIVRMGATAIAEHLPPLVAAVRCRGHPVVWLCDPMHGNTVHFGDNRKTRRLADIVAEAVEFRRILRRHGVHPGGLHAEIGAADITECLGGRISDTAQLATRYTTLCDPRLNPEQAAELVDRWINA